jgi:hypothetical protein
VAEKFRSFSVPGQKISAEPTASTASTESAPESVFLLDDNTRTPQPHHRAAESTKVPRGACRAHSDSSPAPEATSDSDLSCILLFSPCPGPFLPIAREPRPSRHPLSEHFNSHPLFSKIRRFQCVPESVSIQKRLL